MGIYVRRDSPFYWMLLERPGLPSLKESTKIPIAARSAAVRKQRRQDAQEIYAARMADLARARHQLPEHTSTTVMFRTFADWFQTHHIPKRRGGTRDTECLAQLRTFFGDDDLSTINRARVSEYETKRLADRIGPPPPKGRDDLRRTVKPNTVNREVDVLKAMLREAVPRYLPASPLAGRPKLRTLKPKKRVLSVEEEARLLEALPPADQAFYIVAVDTLMRFSNVYNLKRSEDRRTYLAIEDSKTGPYEVPLSRRARAALDSLPKKGEYFFHHRRNAKNLHNARTAFRHLLERACRRADVPYGRGKGITFHTATRATGATRMLRKHVDPKTVMDVGNWRDFRSMQEYLVSDMTLQQKAVNQIGAAGITPQLRKRAKQQKRRRKGAESAA